MRKRLWIGLLLLVLGFPPLLSLALRLGFATPLVNKILLEQMSGLFNGQVRFGSVKTDIFSYLEIDNVLVLTSEGKLHLPVLTADRIRLDYDGVKLIGGRKHLEDAVQRASIDGMQVFLLRDRAGIWNLRDMLQIPEGGRRVKKKQKKGGGGLPILATRVVLNHSVVILNDERKGFQSTVGNLEGTLDARAFPLVVFSLGGRTEGQKRDNLSFAGEWNAEANELFARVDIAEVPLRSYLNYTLPAGGLQFLGGSASLSIRVQQKEEDLDPKFEGRADVRDGSLQIPGISEPLKNFNGSVYLGRDLLLAKNVNADFLGSRWLANGELDGFKSPRLKLLLQNSNVALSPLSEQIKSLKALSLSGTANLAVTVTGQAKDPVVVGDLSSSNLGIAGIEIQDVQAHLVMTRRGVKVSNLEGKLWKGRATGKADLIFPIKKEGVAGSIQGSLEAKDVDLSLFRLHGYSYLPITGVANAQALVHGPLQSPLVDASLISENSYFGKYSMGPLRLEANISGRSLALKAKTWQGKMNANLNISFEKGKPIEFKKSEILFSAFPIDELMKTIAESPDTFLITDALRERMRQGLEHFAGFTDLSLQLGGELRHPDLEAEISNFQGRLLFEEGVLDAKLPSGIPLSLKGRVSYGPDGLGFGELKTPFVFDLVGPGKGIQVSALGTLALRPGIAPSNTGLGLSLSANLGTLDSFRLFSKSSGHAKMSLRLGGSLKSLRADGWLEVKNFATQMQNYFPQIKNGEAEIVVKGQSLSVENISFDSGGTFQGAGNLQFSGTLRPYGDFAAQTDANGLFLDNTGYGRFNLVLQPLDLKFMGSDGMNVSGRLSVHDSELQVNKAKPQSAPETESSTAKLPLSNPYAINLNLLAGVDKNVWIKKEDESVDLGDPLAMLNDALNTAKDTILSPSFEFLLKPTDEDFVIQRQGGQLQIKGSLGIERGSLIFMENEFQITQQDVVNQVVFDGYHGRRGDVTAEAVAPIHYLENADGRMEPKTVHITVDISPLDDESLQAAGLQDTFLNYNNLQFSSDAPFSDDPSLNRQAILSLLLLGDPGSVSNLNTFQSQNVPVTSSSDPSQILSTQIGRMIGGQIRHYVDAYAKTFGRYLFDYIRVTPRVRYQSDSQSTYSNSSAQQAGVVQSAQSSTIQFSWLLDIGKSITDNLYATSQLIYFGGDDINAALAETVNPDYELVNPYGVRVGTEYRFSPVSVLELSYGFGADENLDPIAYTTDDGVGPQSVYLGWRESLPVGSYSPRIARERARDAQVQGAQR